MHKPVWSERCIGASASEWPTDILSPLKMNTIFSTFDFVQTPQRCVCCRKTGNKSRLLLRWVLVACWWEIIRWDGLAHWQTIKLLFYGIADVLRVQISFHLITSFTLSFRLDLASKPRGSLRIAKLFLEFRFQCFAVMEWEWMEWWETPNRI